MSAGAAALLLREAYAAGMSLRAEPDGRVKVKARLPAVTPGMVERLRAHKPELGELLRGECCRRCGGRVEDRRPGWLPFADGTAAHVACEDRWDLERARARAADASSPAALANPPEPTVRQGPLPPARHIAAKGTLVSSTGNSEAGSKARAIGPAPIATLPSAALRGIPQRTGPSRVRTHAGGGRVQKP